MVLTVVAEIALRFYLTIGFVSLLVLLALAITSTDGWVKHLGRNWKRLHRLTYPLGAVALLHFYIQAKLNVSEPVFVSGLFVWLMLWRAVPETWRRDRRITSTAALYSGLAAVSGVATVVMEFGWYGLLPRSILAGAVCERDHRTGPAASALGDRRDRRADDYVYHPPLDGSDASGSASGRLIRGRSARAVCG